MRRPAPHGDRSGHHESEEQIHDQHRERHPQRRRHRDPVRDARRRTADAGLAKFQFRATNRWLSGTHNRSTIHGFHGAKQEMTHRQPFTFDADHPPVLVGSDNGPTPVEYLLHALAACLTAGIANVAAARGVTLTEVSSTVEGDIDLLGILGLSDEVRNGYQQIKINFTVRGDDPRSCARSSSSRAAVGRVRRAHQRRAGVRPGQHRLTSLMPARTR
jgi:uncharacterized OsmC-like protein